MSRALERFKLRALLTITALLVRRAAKTSPRLRRMLNEETLIMQIRTDDGAGGYFAVADGTIRVTHGIHPHPDFTQIWTSARAAVRALTNKDETEILRAMEDGRCRPQGKFLIAMWFNEAMKLARPKA